MVRKKIEFQGTYDGHNIRKSGIATIKIKVPFNQLSKAIRIVTFLQREIVVSAVVGPDDDGFKLARGVFGGMNMDYEGEITVKIDADVVDLFASQDCIGKMINESITFVVGLVEEDQEEEEDED